MLTNSWICSTGKILSYLLILLGFNSLIPILQIGTTHKSPCLPVPQSPSQSSVANLKRNGITCPNLQHNIAVAQVISLTEPLVDQVQRPNRDQRLEKYRQQLRQRQEQFKEEYRQDWDQQQQQWRNQQKIQQQENRDYRRQNQEKIYQQNQLRREEERERLREQFIIVPRQLEP